MPPMIRFPTGTFARSLRARSLRALSLRALSLVIVATAVAAQETTDPTASPGGRALVVGVSEYPLLKQALEARGKGRIYRSRVRLLGPQQDVARMTAALNRTFQIPDERIRQLTTWSDEAEDQPTFANIEAGMKALAAAARPGELVVVYLCGHGSQIPDLDGDESDGMDEVFLPSDTRAWDTRKKEVPGAISDDQMSAWLTAIRAKGARVWLIADSCHSGTLLRGTKDDVRKRNIGADVLGLPDTRSTVRSGSEPKPTDSMVLDESAGGIVAMYGAASFQKAIERKMPDYQGDYCGVFTYRLTEQLAVIGAGATFAELHSRVLAAFAAAGDTHVTPQASGDLTTAMIDGADKEAVMLLGSRKLPGSNKEILTINAGRMRGLQRGDELTVFPIEGTKAPEAVGTVRVEAVTTLEARVSVVNGENLTPDKLREASDHLPVRLSRSTVQLRRVRIAVCDADDTPLTLDAIPTGVRQYLESTDKFGDRGVLVAPEEAEVLVALNPTDRSGWLQRTDAGVSSRRPFASGKFYNILHQYYRVRNLRALSSDEFTGQLPEGVSARFQIQDPEAPGGWKDLGAGNRYAPGDRGRILVHNGTERDLNIWVFGIDQNLALGQLLPKKKNDPRDALVLVGKNATRSFTASDRTLGTEELLVFTLPAGSQDLSGLADNADELQERSRSATGSAKGFLSALYAGADTATRTRGVPLSRDQVRVRLMPYTVAWPQGTPAPPKTSTFAGSITDLVRSEPPASSKPFLGIPDTTRLRGFADAYEKAAPAVFVVRTRGGHGTGFLIDREKGYVLTNDHVISGGVRYDARGRRIVQLLRGKPDQDGVMTIVQKDLQAEILHTDPHRDLALLKILGKQEWLGKHPAIAFGEKGPRPGMDCFILGHPSSGMLWSYRDGDISSLGRSPHDMVKSAVMAASLGAIERERVQKELAQVRPVKIVLSSCGSNPGDSGGPLLDETGRLLAVTYAIPSAVRDDKFTYHVHIDEVKAFLGEVPQARELARPDVPVGLKIGSRVAWGALGKGRHLTSQEGDSFQAVLFDFDGKGTVQAGDIEGLRKAVDGQQGKALSTELALHFSKLERASFYDLDRDGTFDLVRVDHDQDPTADTEFKLEKGKWTVRTEITEPWLEAALLFKDRPRNEYHAAMAQLRAILP